MCTTDILLAVVILLILMVAMLIYCDSRDRRHKSEHLTVQAPTPNPAYAAAAQMMQFLITRKLFIPAYSPYLTSSLDPQSQGFSSYIASYITSNQAAFNAAWAAADLQTKQIVLSVVEYARNVSCSQIKRTLEFLSAPQALPITPSSISNLLAQPTSTLANSVAKITPASVAALVATASAFNRTVKPLPALYASLPNGPIKTGLIADFNSIIASLGTMRGAFYSKGYAPEAYGDVAQMLIVGNIQQAFAAAKITSASSPAQIQAALAPLNLPLTYRLMLQAYTTMYQNDTIIKMQQALS